MNCERCQELTSALLDGELDPVEVQAVQAHLDRCGPCARAKALQAGLARMTQQPGPSDDLLLQIMDRVGWSPRSEAPAWARFGLLVVALAEIVLAVPQLLTRSSGLLGHDAHHLGTWDLALGVGLLVVAWQPERARGLLPFGAALGGGMVLTALIDVVARRVGAWAEVHHVLEVVGVLLLWVIGRSYRVRRGRRRLGRRHELADDGPLATVRSIDDRPRRSA